jgi:hypothetical protein
VLDRISLIRNIGKFDSVSDGANLPLSKLTLIYAENGRGKTTLSAILRSLGSGDPAPIAERKRLSATQPPHVVVKPHRCGHELPGCQRRRESAHRWRGARYFGLRA